MNNQLRIIAGKWRGRKLPILDFDGLRPTPDRVRETVFNWLQGVVGDAHCLDLFAGSGALGFEAASRGARSVTLVENNRQIAQQLQTNCQTLSAQQCQVVNSSAEQFIAQNTQSYDVVFIDPPYQLDLWQSIAEQLEQQYSLSKNATIYIEFPSKAALPTLPQHWQQLKDKKAGDVRYCLYQVGDKTRYDNNSHLSRHI